MAGPDGQYVVKGLGALLVQAVAVGAGTRRSLDLIAQLEADQRPIDPVAPAWLRFARWAKQRVRCARHAVMRLREGRS